MATPIDTSGLRQLVAAGGGIWVGLQDTMNEDEPLVLFNSPTSKSTLALPLSLLSVDNVRGKIQGSDMDFQKRPVKVPRRVLVHLMESAEAISNTIAGILSGEYND
jgi:hypothetical protein